MATDTDFQQVVADGGLFDAVPCDVKTCRASATWSLKLTACGHVGFRCNGCKRDLLMQAMGKSIKHVDEGCGKVSQIWHWDRI